MSDSPKRTKPDFDKSGGLIPAIIQDAATRQVLMLGYMNEKAYKKTRKEGKVTFYSRSKERLWTKGETSGHFLDVVEMKLDCDRDTLLVRVRPLGPVCHTGADTCFDEDNLREDHSFIRELEAIIHDRRVNPSEDSYTSKMFRQGINKIAKKFGEEAVEVVIEAKDDNRDLFLNECADLFYNFMVLLEAKDAKLADVVEVLEGRNKK